MRTPVYSCYTRIIVLAILVCMTPARAPAIVDEGIAAYEVGAYDIAIGHLERGAKRGDTRAMTYLGFMERDGKVPGRARNVQRAAELFTLAANLGNAMGMHALGEMYVEGKGVASDLVEAYKWLQLAADLESSGNAWVTALASREAAKQMLTAEQVSVADLRAQRWIATFDRMYPGQFERMKAEADAKRMADVSMPKPAVPVELPPAVAPGTTARAEDGEFASLSSRVALACGDDVCCRAWYGEGKHGYEDLGFEQCRGYAPHYRTLDFWCNAENNAPAFCKGAPPPAWSSQANGGMCSLSQVAEEIPTHRGAGQPKFWIVWDPEAGAFGAPYASAALEKGLDGVAAENRSACSARGGRKCYDSGGCIAPQFTGVAVPQDRSWAFVACAPTGPAAVAAARALCEQKAGCRCEAEEASRLDFNSWFLPLRSVAGSSTVSRESCTASRHPTTQSGWDVCSICGAYRACLERGGSPTPLPDGPGMDLGEVRSVCDNPYRMNQC